MPELFEFPPTRSNRAKWALEELGVEYVSHIVSLPEGENHSEEHRSVHPLGHVPAYRTADYTMHESVAIVLQLRSCPAEWCKSVALYAAPGG